MAGQTLNRVKSADIELKDRLVSVNRVTKVTKGGRTFSFAAIVVVVSMPQCTGNRPKTRMYMLTVKFVYSRSGFCIGK